MLSVKAFLASLAFFLALFGVCQAGLVRVSSSKVPCPNVTTKSNFQLAPYAGEWYEIEKIPVVFEENLNCIRAIYGGIGENEISVLNVGENKVTGETQIIEGTGRQPFPDTQPGFLVISFPGRPDGGYKVLDTDYTTYSAVYDCTSFQAFKFEYSWILSRTKKMTDANLNRARQVYINQGVNVTQFEPTVQDGTCLYKPVKGN